MARETGACLGVPPSALRRRARQVQIVEFTTFDQFDEPAVCIAPKDEQALFVALVHEDILGNWLQADRSTAGLLCSPDAAAVPLKTIGSRIIAMYPCLVVAVRFSAVDADYSDQRDATHLPGVTTRR